MHRSKLPTFRHCPFPHTHTRKVNNLHISATAWHITFRFGGALCVMLRLPCGTKVIVRDQLYRNFCLLSFVSLYICYNAIHLNNQLKLICIEDKRFLKFQWFALDPGTASECVLSILLPTSEKCIFSCYRTHNIYESWLLSCIEVVVEIS